MPLSPQDVRAGAADELRFLMWWHRFRRKAVGPAHLRTGEWGEQVAEKFLKKAGFRSLGRRVRVGPRDELDLVMRSGEILVFVEVKTRRSEDFGRPYSAVNRKKKLALSRAAIRYMMDLKEKPRYFRFDVVEVVGEPDEASPEVRHIENAFPLDSRYQLPY